MKNPGVFTVLAVIIFSIKSYALHLGPLQVHSKLNQPFHAEIALKNPTSSTLSALQVKLADPKDFRQAGIELTPTLGLLKFAIQKNTQGLLVIHIHSNQKITDPVLSLVLNLAWSNKQLIKTYTVLLDPPKYPATKKQAPLFISKKTPLPLKNYIPPLPISSNKSHVQLLKAHPTEISFTQATVATLRTSNAKMREQLLLLQNQITHLKEQLEEKNNTLRTVQQQLRNLLITLTKL